MDPITAAVLLPLVNALLSYLLGLAGSLRASSIGENAESELLAGIEREKRRLLLITSGETPNNQVASLLVRSLASAMQDSPGSTKHQGLASAFHDQIFMNDLGDWLLTGDIDILPERLRNHIVEALKRESFSSEDCERCATEFHNRVTSLFLGDRSLSQRRLVTGLRSLQATMGEILRNMGGLDRSIDRGFAAEAEAHRKTQEMLKVIERQLVPANMRDISLQSAADLPRITVEKQLRIPSHLFARDCVTGLPGNETGWLHMEAPAQYGSSTAAFLYIQSRFSSHLVLDLRHDSSIDSFEIRRAISLSLEIPNHFIEGKLLEDAFSVLGEGSVVVLDNLPVIVNGSALSVFLSKCARFCASRNSLLVTTSRYSLPVSLSAECNTTLVVLREITESEALSIANLQGCMTPSKHVLRVLQVFSAGFPALALRLADFLRENDWRISSPVFEALLKGDLSQEQQDIVHQTIRLVLHEEELRVAYVTGMIDVPMTKSECLKFLGEVDQDLEQAESKLDSITGPWLVRSSEGHYRPVSLAGPIADRNLSSATKLKVHSVLARILLRRKHLGLLSASACIMHLLKAGEADRAGIFLVMALSSFEKPGGEAEKGNILDAYWLSAALPEGMSTRVRMLVRSAQIKRQLFLGNTVDELLKDFESLVSRSSDEDSPVVGIAGLNASLALADHDPIAAARLVLQSLGHMDRSLQRPDLREFVPSPPEGLSYQDSFWIVLSHLHSIEQIESLVDVLSEVPDGLRKELERSSIYSELCLVVPSRPYLGEHERRTRDFSSIGERLAKIGSRLFEAHSVRLAAGCYRAAVFCHGEVKDYVKIRELLATGRALFEDHAAEKALVVAACARHLPVPESAGILSGSSEILETLQQHWPWDYKDVLLLMLKFNDIPGYSRNTSDRTAQSLDAFVRMQNILPTDEVVSILAELAIYYWRVGDHVLAADHLLRAFEKALEMTCDTPREKGVVCILVHIAGYLTLVFRGEKLPAFASDTNLYAEPYQGVFHRFRPEVAALFDPSLNIACLALAGDLAVLTGNLKVVCEFGRRAGEEMIRRRHFLFSVQVGWKSPIGYTASGEYRTALEHLLLYYSRCQLLARLRREGEVERRIKDRDPLTDNLAADEEKIANDETAKTCGFCFLPHLIVTSRFVGCDDSGQKAAILGAVRKVAEASPSEFWGDVVAIIEGFYDESLHAGHELLEMSGRFSSKGSEHLYAIARLAASVHLKPKSCVARQIEFYDVAYRCIFVRENSLKLLIDEMLRVYWPVALANARFMFSNPGLFESELKSAIESKCTGGKVIRMIALNLGVTIPGSMTGW